jgi:hypothetical protein
MKQIDFEKSVKRQRLTYKAKPLVILSQVYDWFMWLLLVCINVYFLFTALALLITRDQFSSSILITILILFTTFIGLVAGLYYLNKFLVINCSAPERDRKRVIELLNEKYPKINFDRSGQRINQYYKRVGLFSWGRRIVVLLEGENIYINMATLGRYDVPSAFHSVVNYWRLQIIRKKIMEENYPF